MRDRDCVDRPLLYRVSIYSDTHVQYTVDLDFIILVEACKEEEEEEGAMLFI